MSTTELRGLVEIGEYSKWPKRVPLIWFEDTGEILFANLFWKLANKSDIVRDISRKGEKSLFHAVRDVIKIYKKDNFLVGYNPVISEPGMKISTIESETENVLHNLKLFRNEYEKRAKFAQECEAREWKSLGSEREVEEAKSEIRSEKLSVEWIGFLSSRLNDRKFETIFSTNEGNGLIDVYPEENVIYEIELKTQLDVEVQVQVVRCNKYTQTDLTLIDPLNEYSTDTSSVTEIRRNNNQDSVSANDTEKLGNQEMNNFLKNKSFNYIKSFVNIEQRSKIISNVAWHPICSGYVATSYVTHPKYGRSNRPILLLDNEPQVIMKKYAPMSEHDIRINENIFDVSILKDKARSFESDDFMEEDEKDDSDDEDQKDWRKAEIYSSKRKLIEENGTGQRTLTNHHMKGKSDTEENWFSDIKQLYANFEDETKPIDEFVMKVDDLGNENEEGTNSDDSCDSGSSLISQPDFVQQLQVYDENMSDVESTEDNLQLTDTDSCVLIWNTNDDLRPGLKLYNAHEINVLKFCPRTGDIVAGGSSSGQLVIWDVQKELEEITKTNRKKKINDNIADFMENVVGWKINWTSDCPILKPVATSERNTSHLEKVTCMEWMHPSLKITLEGKLVKSDCKEQCRQILTSSFDGRIKIWEIKSSRLGLPESAGPQIKWNIELIYTILVNNPFSEKYFTPIRFFQICIPAIRYNVTKESDYEYDSNLSSKFQTLITLSNNTGEIGVIRWCGKDDDRIENCKHEWWSQVHDSTITSLSQNYYFPNITLSTGGRIFSLWNAEYKGGPILWQQYEKDLSICEGTFSPFHPAIIYISRNDGNIDIWNVEKQIHCPVKQILATGFSISCLRVVTPPCDQQYRLSIADSDGNFHILGDEADIECQEVDLTETSKFFKLAEESSKQLQKWNKTWQDQTTKTDIYGYEHKPQPRRPRFFSQRSSSSIQVRQQSSEKIKDSESQSEQERTVEFTDGSTFVEKLCQTNEYKKSLSQASEKLKQIKEEKYERFRVEVLEKSGEKYIDTRSTDDIITKYTN